MKSTHEDTWFSAMDELFLISHRVYHIFSPIIAVAITRMREYGTEFNYFGQRISMNILFDQIIERRIKIKCYYSLRIRSSMEAIGLDAF